MPSIYHTANKPSNADVGLSNLQNWSYSHSYTDATGGATKYASGKAVADAYNALNSSKLNAASYTAADVLAKLKTVGGAASGLDADLLDGQHGDYYRAWANLTGVPAAFPPSSHAHTWTSITGKPATFPPSSHSHPWSEVTGKPATYPPANHGHSWEEITGKPELFNPTGETFADGSGWTVIGKVNTPNGVKTMILQWGWARGMSGPGTTKYITFPIAFNCPVEQIHAQGTGYPWNTSGGTSSVINVAQIHSVTTVGMRVQDGDTDSTTFDISWEATGYI
ncbi:hypothetical protein GU3_08570 [Oceanimonas sp. GK1]|nr:hypothetical protein GU3_08570 [Oceanimonas sp. GK1]